ncbi:MAG: sigma-70 family RNA polymerase sigma factor [bacterium]|nr:sigma-70 family RNA polymerase sigma factor [bacterium]
MGEEDKYLHSLVVEYQKTKNLELRNEIVNSNIGLVNYIYNYRFSSEVKFKKDLISYGIIGLINAIETFDSTKNILFSTYAGTCIQNEMFKGLDKLYGFGSRRLRSAYINVFHNEDMPINYLKNEEIIESIAREFCKKSFYERKKDFNDETEIINNYFEKIKVAVQLFMISYSFEELKSMKDDNSIASSMQSCYEIDDLIDEIFDNEINIEIVNDLLNLLDDNEAQIFRLKYGIECNKLSKSEIMELYNLTLKELRSIETRCILKLRNSIKKEKIDSRKVKYLKWRYNI